MQPHNCECLFKMSCGKELEVFSDKAEGDSNYAKVYYQLPRPMASDMLPEESVDQGLFFLYFIATSYLRIHQCEQSSGCTVEGVFTEELNEHKTMCQRQLRTDEQVISLVKENGQWKIKIDEYPSQMQVYMNRWGELLAEQQDLLLYEASNSN